MTASETFLASPAVSIYLAQLGVTCLLLNPIHPSPDRDDSYDVTDFYNVHPRIGTPATSSSSSTRPRTGACG